MEAPPRIFFPSLELNLCRVILYHHHHHQQQHDRGERKDFGKMFTFTYLSLGKLILFKIQIGVKELGIGVARLAERSVPMAEPWGPSELNPFFLRPWVRFPSTPSTLFTIYSTILYYIFIALCIRTKTKRPGSDHSLN